MDRHSADALLRDALLLLNDRPNFGLRSDPHFTSYRLAARIEAWLGQHSGADEDRHGARR
jgi:hypothetical protein